MTMENWKSNPEICIVRIKSDDDWAAAFVIDGRNYATREDYERVVTDAFDGVNSSRLAAEFETSSVGLAEPPFRLPSWEQYRESLAKLKPVGLYREMYEDRDLGLPSIFESVTEHVIEDRERVLGYMRAAPGVFDVLDVLKDLINDTDQIMSASSLISDGVWIWRVDSMHYLSRYDLDIPEEFLRHVRERNYEPPASIDFTPEFESRMLTYF